MGIKRSVGSKAKNDPYDVAFIRAMLNYQIMWGASKEMKALKTMPVVGWGPFHDLIQAIRIYQMFEIRVLTKANGRIDPDDETFRRLTGKIEGAPESAEAHASVKWRAIHQIHLLLNADDRDALFGKTHAKDPVHPDVYICMLKKLVDDKDVDDAFLTANNVETVTGSGDPVTGPIVIKESHAFNLFGNRDKNKVIGLKPFRNDQERAQAAVDLHDHMVAGMRELNRSLGVEAGPSKRMGDAPLLGRSSLTPMFMRVLKVKEWILDHNKNERSIYSCIKITIIE